MKAGLLGLIILAALVIIACGVWVTRALIAELRPRKATVRPAPQPEPTLPEAK